MNVNTYIHTYIHSLHLLVTCCSLEAGGAQGRTEPKPKLFTLVSLFCLMLPKAVDRGVQCGVKNFFI